MVQYDEVYGRLCGNEGKDYSQQLDAAGYFLYSFPLLESVARTAVLYILLCDVCMLFRCINITTSYAVFMWQSVIIAIQS